MPEYIRCSTACPALWMSKIRHLCHKQDVYLKTKLGNTRNMGGKKHQVHVWEWVFLSVLPSAHHRETRLTSTEICWKQSAQPQPSGWMLVKMWTWNLRYWCLLMEARYFFLGKMRTHLTAKLHCNQCCFGSCRIVRPWSLRQIQTNPKIWLQQGSSKVVRLVIF